MRLTISQEQFLKKLQMVEHAVNDRSALPILANILLQTTETELMLTATDLDVGIQCRFPLSQPVEQGAVTLPARKLTTIVRELPPETITLEAKKNHTATLHCGQSNFRIPGLPAEDFPVLPPPETNVKLSIPQGVLKALITQTAYAMSMEETRFILNGTLFLTQKDVLTLVSTDGRRLAVASSPLNETVSEPLQVVIPAKTVRELGRLLESESPEDVIIAPLKENQLTFQFGFITVITRLIEGQFPQYEKVIPSQAKQSFTCNRQALFNALRRASLMTSATSQAVLFELQKGKIVVSKESPELGSAHDEVEVQYQGEPISIAFNPEFWLDVLKILDTEQVTIEVVGSDKPAVIRQPGFTYLVLPMRLN